VHYLSQDEIEKKYKLTANISCGNFVLFDKDYHIKKYNNEVEILEEFYQHRLLVYKQRKESMIKKLN
jgi:DNA gyrase/topoisomerase IV subunit A